MRHAAIRIDHLRGPSDIARDRPELVQRALHIAVPSCVHHVLHVADGTRRHIRHTGHLTGDAGHIAVGIDDLRGLLDLTRGSAHTLERTMKVASFQRVANVVRLADESARSVGACGNLVGNLGELKVRPRRKGTGGGGG